MATLARCRTCKAVSDFDVLAHQGNCAACWAVHCEQLEAERREEQIRDAAPELLAACNGVMEALALGWGIDEMVFDGTFAACREAIAKAETSE